MTRALFSFLALGALALVIGCGGGAGRGTFIPTATPTPHVGATTVPVGAAATSVAVADGNGNTASFTIPQAVGGASANMTMTLSGSLPAGISVPAIRRAVGKPDAVGANVNALQYVSVVMDGNLGISTSPAVTFGLASPAPASAQMYLLLWDPARAGQQGWIVLLGPGTVGNPRTLVTFNGVPTGQSYAAGNTYVYALVTTSGAVPTATPAPVPTTAPRAQSTTMPAYCANFATASPAPNLGPGLPQPVIFNDNSALNGDVVFYVTDTGQDAGGRPAAAGELVSARALNAQGQWSTPNPLPAYTAGPLTLAPIQPIPLKCFPGSIGVNGVPKYSGRQFKIPVAVSGLIYIAYAPSPAPGSTAIPDPFNKKFGFVGTP
ncbi:MAG TPA: hypothetical protein VFL13_12845, partial [Candidatus Baltobacteraceae bacterium]|nr:hypothetical protein [Candidatus Baltobacteraceae bacterium]